MIEIRIHGRGGQGAVTFAEVLAKAAAEDGKWTQAFPAFGVERRGAPVKAFCRIADKQITIRSQVYEPDWVVVLDPTLMDNKEVFDGLKPNTVIVANTKEAKGIENPLKTFDATSLALKIIGKTIVNTAMLGVFAKASGLVSLDSILKMLEESFKGELLQKNRELVREAYKEAA